MQAYIRLKRRKDNILSLRYPDGHEVVSLVSEVQHPVIREALVRRNFTGGLDLVAISPVSSREDLMHALQALDGEAQLS